MPRSFLFRSLCFLLLSLAVSAPGRAAGKGFYIDESTDFSGNGCENADLNDVTGSLQTSLVNNGWTGQRFTNSSAWPQDFYEQTFPGLSGVDHVYGDNKTLAVYAGHGDRALLQFGFRRLGMCTVTLDTQARLGTLAGDHADYAMYLTSCTLNTDALRRHFRNEIRQSFGYHNSPSVKGDQPRDFFEATNNLDNAHAWIQEMEDRSGWFTGDNSPLAMTFGANGNDCLAVRNGARLRAGTFLTDPAEPFGAACALMIDHGADGC